ncbi:tetratricopeptide repeat protein 38 family protein, partial [Staphylococcus epidermidis]
MLAALHGADAAIEAAIAEGPDFALAHLGRARVHQHNKEGAADRAQAADARQLVAAATPRERQHIEIIASVIEGQGKMATTAAEQHLSDYPRDAQILSLLLGAFGLYAFSGRPDHDAARLAITERYAKDHGDDWWLLTYLGRSKTEAGYGGPGRPTTERGHAPQPARAGT